MPISASGNLIMQKILIIGATSAIAEATAKRYAKQGAALYLLARNEERLQDLARDLEIRGASSVAYALFEANEFTSHASLLNRAFNIVGNIDIALIAHGSLGNQKACEKEFDSTLHELNTNAISFISLLTHLANYFEKSGQGTIVAIGSVAGDRGRQSNYVYGTAKGAVAIFLQGMRHRLYKSGVSVITIKPGFVDTPMTRSFKKNALWVDADTIAAGIEKSIKRKKDVAYIPSWWGMIMFLIRALPEFAFKKTSL